MMALKRKRSSATFRATISDTSSNASSSPMSCFYTQTKPIEALHDKSTWAFPTYESSDNDQQAARSYLNTRTRKRHRDNRPDEQSIYGT